ncbi:MAG: hypothetical protein WDN76_04345 [Alphaproteobacteria bacterium]
MRKSPLRSLAVRFSIFVCTFVLLVGVTSIAVLRHESEVQARQNSRMMMEGLGSAYAFSVSRMIARGHLEQMPLAHGLAGRLPRHDRRAGSRIVMGNFSPR